ncbi:imm11 family protein [Psychromonas algicola]|uniref:imm11 family protein n=1 Tax=Psychromonas algicola TaxID=2555642 RepID=UPI001068082D|nr:DUF1629 domain-containing protein [Psychromonas sp. RZ5]TEW43763.1 hypothetical protein E2R67_15650 [Psychromonas sp. RZ5]
MYYVIDSKTVILDDQSAAFTINNNFKLAGIRLWKTGKPIAVSKKDNIPNPVTIDFDVYQGYNGELPHIRDLGITMMSQTLVDILISAGVDNLELFPAILKNNQTGQTLPYQIFNVIGLVSAMDLQASDYETYKNTAPKGDTIIHQLVLDESRIQDVLLFRLAENVSTLLVHECIKNKIEEAGLQGVKFIRPEEYSQI